MLRLGLGYRWEQRQDQLCTRSFTVGEILVGPYKLGSSETARQIREVFREPLVEVIPYTLETADFYGRIRAQHGVSPDSIHLACAAQARIDLFLTNDAALVGKIIPGIQFMRTADPKIDAGRLQLLWGGKVGLDSNLF